MYYVDAAEEFLKNYGSTGTVPSENKRAEDETRRRSYLEQVPDKDSSGHDMPQWKRAILARQMADKEKEQQEEMKKLKEEEDKFKDMPPWKRAIIEKREARKKQGESSVAPAPSSTSPAQPITNTTDRAPSASPPTSSPPTPPTSPTQSSPSAPAPISPTATATTDPPQTDAKQPAPSPPSPVGLVAAQIPFARISDWPEDQKDDPVNMRGRRYDEDGLPLPDDDDLIPQEDEEHNTPAKS